MYFRIQRQYRVFYDDTDALMAIGGSELCPSFKGVIGDVVWYRRRAVQRHEVSVLQSTLHSCSRAQWLSGYSTVLSIERTRI